MRRAVAGFWWSPTDEGTPALVVTAIFFALGGLLGGVWAFGASGSGAETMTDYLREFLLTAQEGALRQPMFWELVWRALRWPLAAFLFGFTALGVFGLPVLIAARGFCLSFSISAFAQTYGGKGLMTAFLLLGVPAFVYVPVFFLLSAQSFSAACALVGRTAGQGRREGPYHREYFFRSGVCAAALCLGISLEQYLVPALITSWAKALIQ